MQPDPGKFPTELRDALSAVVGVRTTVPDDAYTAAVLGTERAGHGVIIRHSGLVVTIGYLVAEAETIWISQADGNAFPGHVLAYDFETGFGLVQILARVDVPAIAVGESGAASIGEEVVVAGIGDESQRRVARIVARQEFAGYWEYALDDALFTAPAHPNWGGAAVINRGGQLIGIGSLLVQGAGERNETEDLNMVVPIDILKPRLDTLLSTGRPATRPRPWLGLFATQIANRVIVMNVASYGPAAKGDLRQGDVVLAVKGREVNSLSAFFRGIWGLGPAGVAVPLLVYRDGETMEITVLSADRNEFLKAPTAH